MPPNPPNRPIPSKPPLFHRDWTVAPGSVLADELKERRMTPSDLASATGLTPPYIDALLAGNEVLGEDVAERLEAATGVSAQFWLSMEANYRTDLAAGRKNTNRNS